MTFAALFVSEKREKKKSYFMFLYGGSKPPPYAQSPSTTNRQNKRYAFHPVSAGTGVTPAMHLLLACRQCVHESARLFRVICSHAWYSLDCGERKTADFRFILCRTHLPRMARATNTCTRKKIFKRMENPLK